MKMTIKYNEYRCWVTSARLSLYSQLRRLSANTGSHKLTLHLSSTITWNARVV